VHPWNLDYGDKEHQADGRYLTDVLADEAVQFIQRHSKQPFFLHLTYNAPHGPLQAPDDEVAPFAETGKFTKGVSILYGMIRRMDKGLARVLHEIKRQGIEENTIVVFTSDNGPQFGGTGEMRTNRFNCGFNGAKGSVYEGGIRVPLVIRWPAGLDGVDIWSVLRGEGGKVDTRRFWQRNRYTPLVTCNAAMRDGEWKLVRPTIREAMHIPPEDMKWNTIMRYGPEEMTDIIRTPEPPREIPPPPPPELYNIAHDPLERSNLADSEPERTSRMLRELESWFEEVEAERATIDDKW